MSALAAGLVVVCSIVVCQAENETRLPNSIRQQIEDHFLGDLIFEGTFGDQKISGSESWKWTEGKQCVIVEGTVVMNGERFLATSLGGWDAKNKAFVVTGFAGGDSWTTRWTEFAPEGWKGQTSGIYQGQAYESPTKTEFLKDSIRYEDTTAGKPWVTVSRRSSTSEQTDAATVFKAYTDQMVGTWVPLDDDGQNEDKTEVVLDGKFLLGTNKRASGIPTSLVIVGIDPATQRCTVWGFTSSGAVWGSTLALSGDGHLIGTPTRLDPSSDSRYEARISKEDQDTMKFEMVELPAGGEPKTVFESTLRRKR